MKWNLLCLCLPLLPVLATGQEVSAGFTPQHVVVSDFNRDGAIDLAYANAFDDSVTIHLQNLSGGFPISQTLSVGINPGSLDDFPRYLYVWDINRDGFSDLTVLCSGSFPFGFEPSVQTLMNLGDGSFARIEPDQTTSSFVAEEFPIQFDTGHLTPDRYPDLAVANLEGRTIRILPGDGSGRFDIGQNIAVDSGGEGPQDLVVTDLDGDGFDDIITVTANSLLAIRQTGAGVFGAPQSFSLPASGGDLRALVLDDLNVDGAYDVAVADAIGRIQILYGIEITGASTGFEVKTDLSLSGCSDVATIFWDGDAKPDLVVANRTGDTVTVLGSTGLVASLPTGSLPRRLETGGDLNGDGRNDIVTANEGDQALPTNPDGNIFTNSSLPLGSPYNPILEEAGTLEDIYEINLPHPLGLSAPEDDDRLWVLESSRRALQETDIGASERDRIEFGFEMGGVHFKGKKDGYVVERFASRIYKFETEDGETVEIKETKTFSFAPGELGFGGLAFDEEADEFYVSVPAMEKVLRLDPDGNLVAEIDVAPAAWDLAWDKASNRLLVANPGRSDIRAYSSAGILDSGRSFDMADYSALFSETGLAGVAWIKEEDERYLLSTAGLLLRTDVFGAVLETNTLSPLVEIFAADFDKTRNEAYLLSLDGHVKRIEFPGLDEEDSFSLWAALSADMSFIPAGVAFNSDTDRVLIGDRDRAVVARFTRSGSFDGFQDLSGSVDLEGGRVSGIEYDPETVSICFRTEFSVISGPSPVLRHIPSGYSTDISLGQGLLASGLPNPEEILFSPFPAGGEGFVTSLPGAFGRGAIAFDGSGRLIHFGGAIASTWSVNAPSVLSNVDNWNVYD